MKRFVLEITVVVALVAGLLFMVCPPVAMDDNSYFASVTDKFNRLEAAPGPRVIFVGGSSVAFGNDSPRIGGKLNRAPVNMGVHADLGARYVVSSVEPFLRGGDLVVISLEYYLFSTEGLKGRYDYLLDVRLYEQRSAEGMKLQEFKDQCDNMLYRYIKLFQDRVERYRKVRKLDHLSFGEKLERLLKIRTRPMYQASPPYSRDAFNRCGDVVAHLAMPSVAADRHVDFVAEPPEWENTAALLNRFAATCRGRGVDLVYFYPAIPKAAMEDNPRFQRLHAFLRKHLHMPLLNTPAETAYPDDCFFDTGYHLNRRGRDRRNDLLLERLLAHPGAKVRGAPEPALRPAGP